MSATAGGVSLVVLTGGASRRMGRDKATLDAGGMPLAARPAHALAGLVGEVVLAGRAVPGVPGRAVADGAGRGPGAGLLAGLRAASFELVAVAACDMPSLEPALVDLLLARLRADPGLEAACASSGEGLEPLPAALRRSAAASVEALIGAGESSLRGLLAGLRLAVVDEEEWKAAGATPGCFESWNVPADVRHLGPEPI